jgi:hypothetical protein
MWSDNIHDVIGGIVQWRQVWSEERLNASTLRVDGEIGGFIFPRLNEL